FDTRYALFEWIVFLFFFFFSSRRRHTRSKRDWSSDVCSSDLFFQMMPFFTLGLATTPQMLRRLKNLPGRVWIGAAVLAAGLSFSVLTHDMFSASRFFLRGSYADGPYETPLAMLMQTLILATGMIGTIALLLMTPRRGTFWTM